MQFFKRNLLRLFIVASVLASLSSPSHASENMMIVIIDGARYSETFGDPTHQYIPRMAALADSGTMIDTFYNDSLTYTSRAIPALWCGTWTEVRDTTYAGSRTRYAVKPTIFEYYRKQKNMPAEQCFYVLKFVSSLWLPSFDPNYGPDYWPKFLSVGNTDEDVATQALQVMDTFQPHFMWVYLADVDHAGHSGDWQSYTLAIQKADSIVGALWQALQSDPFYRNSTTLFVTNDHGRHDDQHGGFSGHGDDCQGCRHIQFLAIGPEIKKQYVSTHYRRTPDMAVTAAYLLGIQATRASGDIMTEILRPTSVETKPITARDFALQANYPNPFNPSTRIHYSLSAPSDVNLAIYNLLGEKVKTLVNERQSAGLKEVAWNGRNNTGSTVDSGIYFYTLTVGNQSQTRKMLLVK